MASGIIFCYWQRTWPSSYLLNGPYAAQNAVVNFIKQFPDGCFIKSAPMAVGGKSRAETFPTFSDREIRSDSKFVAARKKRNSARATWEHWAKFRLALNEDRYDDVRRSKWIQSLSTFSFFYNYISDLIFCCNFLRWTAIVLKCLIVEFFYGRFVWPCTGFTESLIHRK